MITEKVGRFSNPHFNSQGYENMKKIIPIVLALICFAGACSKIKTKSNASHGHKTKSRDFKRAENDKNKIWKLSAQAWTFRKYTLFETIELLEKLGIKYIEIYPGQRLNRKSKVRVSENMTDIQIAELKAKLAKSKIKPVAFGVVSLPAKNRKQCRKVFLFAQKLGIKMILSEPVPTKKHFDFLEKLTEKNQINLAIHNHPKPSRYWKPQAVLRAVKGRSLRLGAAADTGHWVRSGLDPIKCLKQLEGRILHVHFKDLNRATRRGAKDVPWGTGISQAKAQLAELRRQNFTGYISMEYEANWSLRDLKKCVRFFRKQTKKFSKIKPAWQTLFDGENLNNFTSSRKGWALENGTIAWRKGAGFLWSKKQYKNFVLDLEVKTAPEANSGIFLRASSKRNWLHSSIEVQVLDKKKSDSSTHIAGAFYDLQAPRKNAFRKAGLWNRYVITCKENFITVVLNDEFVNRINLNRWSQAHLNPDGTPNKFNRAIRDLPRTGFIGLQDHNSKVWYRNIRIRELD